ncbi:MAG: penicillin-binding protein activator [Candidatus Tectomicrobia bacterium]|uniref:Penicillin-binding protein activator n=1 Tax=Tectimicrobiota bacterium TaxID=2528274 RepID=A0A932GRN2_UNCTE|nr:penicillin-binding protein activator [Candidatus Tectomicrobia bacterium]
MQKAKRQSLGSCSVVLVCLLVLAFAGPALSAQSPIKVGLLLPYTSVFAVQGTDTTKGFELYLDQAGWKAGGREIQLTKEDTEVKPDVGLAKLRKMIERDQVKLVVGPVSSAVALAIHDYVNREKVPLIIPVAFTRLLTAPDKAGPSVFRLIETTDQSNYPMGEWVFKNTPYRRVIIMASDFVAGRDSVSAFMAGFKNAGGTIVREIYPPLNIQDFGPYLSRLVSENADAVYAWFAGSDAIRFLKQYAEYGLKGKTPLLGYNTLTDDTILPAIGDAAIGVISVGHYSASLESEENTAFVRAYRAKYGSAPTRYSEEGYTSAQLAVAAIEDLKGGIDNKDQFLEAIRRVAPKIKAVRGPIRFDRYQQVITNIYVMKTDKVGGQLVNSIIARIPEVSQEATWGWWQKK